MALTRTDETDLITVLYQGVLEDPPWRTFLARLQRRVRAPTASIIVQTGPTPSAASEYLPSGSSGSTAAAVGMMSLFEYDPMAFQRLRPNRVYGEDALSPPTSHGAEPPIVPSHARIIRLTEPGGAGAWLTIASDERNFSASEGALLDALGSHLAIALANFVEIGRTRLRAAVASGGLARLGFGWIAFDAAARMIDHSDNAADILRTVAAIHHIPGGGSKLTPTRASALTEATLAVAILCRTGPRAHRLASDPHVDILMVPLDDAALTATTGIATLGIVGGGAVRLPVSTALLSDIYGLSPKEAALAAALTRGESLAEAAARLGLTLETARNYSKRIFAKTGTHGQPDLVRTILTSVAALGW